MTEGLIGASLALVLVASMTTSPNWVGAIGGLLFLAACWSGTRS